MKTPCLILTGKEAEKFAKAIDNPPKANKALKEIINEVKKIRIKDSGQSKAIMWKGLFYNKKDK